MDPFNRPGNLRREKITDLARNLGKGLSQFKKGLNEVEDTKDDIVNEIKKVQSDATNNDDSKKTG